LSGAAFINGGFELPAISNSVDFNTTPTGWTKNDPTCPACDGLFIQLYTAFGLPTVGQEGQQAYGFGGNGVTSGDIAQTFDTVSGATYQVSFQYVIQQGPEFEDLLAEVLNGASVLTNAAIRFNNQAWVTRTMTFTAASAATTLRFSDATGAVDPGSGGSTNWALDAVTVTQTSGPPGVPGVPEPASFLLVAAAAAVFAVKRRYC
jgi:hypothetical protein